MTTSDFPLQKATRPEDQLKGIMAKTKPSPVACAAVRDLNGKIWLGKRHNDCFWLMAQFDVSPTGSLQGFVNTKGTFLLRSEALRAALKNNQVDRRDLMLGQDELYSEDLY